MSTARLSSIARQMQDARTVDQRARLVEMYEDVYGAASWHQLKDSGMTEALLDITPARTMVSVGLVLIGFR